jgi:hypothetical protein
MMCRARGGDYHAQQTIFDRRNNDLTNGGQHRHGAEPPIVGIQTVTTYSSDGRITAVDPNARTVTVTFPNGATRTHNASPAVANFSDFRVASNLSNPTRTGTS